MQFCLHETVLIFTAYICLNFESKNNVVRPIRFTSGRTGVSVRARTSASVVEGLTSIFEKYWVGGKIIQNKNGKVKFYPTPVTCLLGKLWCFILTLRPFVYGLIKKSFEYKPQAFPVAVGAVIAVSLRLRCSLTVKWITTDFPTPPFPVRKIVCPEENSSTTRAVLIICKIKGTIKSSFFKYPL